uniref:VKc domain-containing protein n=1 Tax=Parastrongyloides trichosuri TaxID=131310 RepID=A0A0N5A6G3_PARTI
MSGNSTWVKTAVLSGVCIAFGLYILYNTPTCRSLEKKKKEKEHYNKSESSEYCMPGSNDCFTANSTNTAEGLQTPPENGNPQASQYLAVSMNKKN